MDSSVQTLRAGDCNPDAQVLPLGNVRELEEKLAWERERGEVWLNQLNHWKDFAQKWTGVDANDHGWLRAEVDSRFSDEQSRVNKALDDIRLACWYGLEEDIDSKEAMLKQIDKYARDAMEPQK